MGNNGTEKTINASVHGRRDPRRLPLSPPLRFDLAKPNSTLTAIRTPAALAAQQTGRPRATSNRPRGGLDQLRCTAECRHALAVNNEWILPADVAGVLSDVGQTPSRRQGRVASSTSCRVRPARLEADSAERPVITMLPEDLLRVPITRFANLQR
jgi:hypothetical protein